MSWLLYRGDDQVGAVYDDFIWESFGPDLPRYVGATIRLGDEFVIPPPPDSDPAVYAAALETRLKQDGIVMVPVPPE